jgi:hypothetical protein
MIKFVGLGFERGGGESEVVVFQADCEEQRCEGYISYS